MKWYTAFVVMCVYVLFDAAMWFPGYYSRLYDERTLDQAVFTDINMSTYETSYDCFMRKLYAIAKAWNQGTLSAVRTDELELSMDKGQLAKIARKEMKKLTNLGLMNTDQKLRSKNLTRCERYTIYASSDSSNMKGISCWKLVFENAKKSTTIFFDEEYHKIYYAEYAPRKEDSKHSVTSAGSAGARDFNDIYDMTGQDGAESFTEGEGVVDYYDVASFVDVPCASYMQSGSVWMMEFDYKYQIGFIKDAVYGENGYTYRFGLPVEKMIQF